MPKFLSDIRHYTIKNTIYTVKDMSRGLYNSITVLLKILACFVLKVPSFVYFFSFLLFIFVFYFIFICYFRLYLKHFSFIFAAFKKRKICEFACAKRLVGSSNFGYMVCHYLNCITLAEQTQLLFKRFIWAFVFLILTCCGKNYFCLNLWAWEFSSIFMKVQRKTF